MTPSDLERLLQELNLPADEKVRCWLDGPDGWALDYWSGLDGVVRWNGAGHDPRDQTVKNLFSRITQGRIFSPSGELKWRVLPALGEFRCRVVFLGNWAFPSLESLPLRKELAALSRHEATYPLWGQQTKDTPGEWIELRIPHRLRYPVHAEAPVQGRVIAKVRVEIWKDSRSEPQFIRLCDLTADWEE
ncbi:MAG: hypothetical protein KatS3mg105_4328 [Gemmatales bacterium]|nr:MAG: hypothetical protein KatS3mg105_4328 [Gemmatales bacterium]